MAKKIALVGAGCVGKTTIFNRLKPGLVGRAGTVFLEEAGREYFRDNPTPEEERFKFLAQSAIQRMAYSREQRAHAKRPDLIVCDNSTISPAVWVASEGDRKGARELFIRVRGWVSTYDNIFLLDPEGVPFEKDAERPESEAKRQQAHETFVDFFTSHNIVHDLLSGTVEERLAQVRAVLL